MGKKKKQSIEETVQHLIIEVDNLKKHIAALEKTRTPTVNESLIRLWDNDYDERWNTC